MFILIYVLEAFLYTAMLSRIKVVLSLSNRDWQCNWLLGNYKGNLKQCRGRGGRGLSFDRLVSHSSKN